MEDVIVYGVDIYVVGEMGIGNICLVLVVVCFLLVEFVEKLIGVGMGICIE